MILSQVYQNVYLLFSLIGQTADSGHAPLYDATPHVTRPAGKETHTRSVGAEISGLLL